VVEEGDNLGGRDAVAEREEATEEMEREVSPRLRLLRIRVEPGGSGPDELGFSRYDLGSADGEHVLRGRASCPWRGWDHDERWSERGGDWKPARSEGMPPQSLPTWRRVVPAKICKGVVVVTSASGHLAPAASVLTSSFL
jgi:hypothetical protein